jgi:hypothetical protein
MHPWTRHSFIGAKDTKANMMKSLPSENLYLYQKRQTGGNKHDKETKIRQGNRQRVTGGEDWEASGGDRKTEPGIMRR